MNEFLKRIIAAKQARAEELRTLIQNATIS